MKKIIGLLLISIALVSCVGDGIEKSKTNTDDYEVTYLFEKDGVRYQHLAPFNHPVPMHGAARCQLLYERVERESGHVCCLFVAGQIASSPCYETFSLSHLGFTNYAPFLPVGLSLSMSGLVALKIRLGCWNTLHFTIQIAFLSCGHPLCLFSQWFIGHIRRHLSI